MQHQGYKPVDRAYSSPPYLPSKDSGRSKRYRKYRFLLLLFAVLFVCLAIGGLYLGKAYMSVRLYWDVIAPNITIDDINMEGLTRDEAFSAIMENVEKRQGQWTLSVEYNGHTYITLDYATLGIVTDVEQVKNLINKAWAYAHTGNIFERKRDLDLLNTKTVEEYTTQSSSNDSQLDGILDIISKDIARDPIDAAVISFDPNAEEPFTIRDEIYGLMLHTDDVKTTVYRMSASAQSGRLELEPEKITPAVTRADIMKTVALISKGTTPVDKNSTENRTNNIRVAFAKINGTILNVGEKFSFNSKVGWRTFENGFFEAVEYAYGELVMGVGGGVCQASTTVYLAAVCGGLQIIDRTPHSDPVSYTSFGQDATVYMTRDKKIDFIFRNNSSGPIYITAQVKPDSANSKRFTCLVRIYGQSLGENVHYRLESKETKLIPAPVEPERIKDSDAAFVVYTDQEYRVLSARDGHIVETYLQRIENGVMVSEKLISTDTYLARAERYYVGITPR
jgi:vancomycin resistance protein YoaR